MSGRQFTLITLMIAAVGAISAINTVQITKANQLTMTNDERIRALIAAFRAALAAEAADDAARDAALKQAQEALAGEKVSDEVKAEADAFIAELSGASTGPA